MPGGHAVSRLAGAFVIASLRSDLPVDLAGDWFSSRDSGSLPRSLALPRNDGMLCHREAIPGGHAVSLLIWQEIGSVAGIQADCRGRWRKSSSARYPEGCRLLRSDLPVDLAGDWFSHQHSGRQSTLVVLPRSLAQKFVIASLRSDLPVDLAGDWFSSRDSGRLPRSLALPRNDGMLGHRESIPGGHAVSRLAYPEGTLSPCWHSGRQSTLVVLPRSLALPRNDEMLGHCEAMPGGHAVSPLAYREGTVSSWWHIGRLPHFVRNDGK